MARRLTRAHWRLVAYVAVVLGGVWGFWRIETTVNTQEDLIADNRAQDCIDDWELVDGGRNAAERGVRGGSQVILEALLEMFGSEVTEETVDRFREITAARADTEVDLVRSEIPDPACDLAAAREQLGLPPIGDNP